MRLLRNLFKILSNNRGEIDLGGKETFTAAEVKELVTKQLDALVQPKIDGIVQNRLSQERNKYGDYDDLKKFKADHETKAAADNQKQLEAQGKYEEAMKANNLKLEELNKIIVQKDGTISGMTIGNALTNQIVAQNGYLEESLAMLRSSAEIKDGVVVIKDKDTNGLDQSFSVADGVKSFLEKRPHLVKAQQQSGGGGSGAGDAGAGGAGGGEDLNSLNELFQKQTYANDYKGAKETRAKIQSFAAKHNINVAGGTIA